eukprot:1683063-Amphidinium_carterae.2
MAFMSKSSISLALNNKGRTKDATHKQNKQLNAPLIHWHNINSTKCHLPLHFGTSIDCAGTSTKMRAYNQRATAQASRLAQGRTQRAFSSPLAL